MGTNHSIAYQIPDNREVFGRQTGKEEGFMHAIIRQGNGKFYVSTVFGYYTDIRSQDKHQSALERIYNTYYVIWNEDRSALIRQYDMEKDTQYLNPTVLICDIDQDGWILDENGFGGVGFLPRETADAVCDSGVLSDELRRKCLASDDGYAFWPYPKVISEKDISDLLCVSGHLHDASITSLNFTNDGKLHVLFDSVWGFKIEFWFWGDVEYDLSAKDPQIDEFNDTIWYDASVLAEDGFLYLVDDDVGSPKEISGEVCYFKARHMMYHVIPD